MLTAIQYEILRGVQANGRVGIPLEKKPVRVATILNEEKFKSSGGKMVHNDTVFLEDSIHDWDWRDGKFYYYTRIAESADVLLVYELKKD